MIYQGQTTNESFKWASVVLTHKRLLKAHDKYLELSRPENIEKIELIERENDELNHEKLSDVQFSSAEVRNYNSVVDDYKDDSNNQRCNGINTMKMENVEKIIDMNEKKHQSHHQNQNQSDYHDVSDYIRNEDNDTAVTSTKQRSDSTFDGAPSAIIEDVCNCIIRKEGSSSSGSTSSSRCYDYDNKYADNEDVMYHENDHNYDDDNGSIYWKDSEVNGDGQADYLEVYSNFSEKQMRRKGVDVSIGKEKEIEREREWNDKDDKTELSCNESQVDDRCEKIFKELNIKETINDRKIKDVSSALESVQEKEVVASNEDDSTPGCVPSPFPSKSTLPDSEGIFPEYLSKHPGHIPPNCYKIGFFTNLKNIWIPPSAVALRLLNENGKRLDSLENNRCDSHNNDNNDVSRGSDQGVIMSIDSDKNKTAAMVGDETSKKCN